MGVSESNRKVDIRRRKDTGIQRERMNECMNKLIKEIINLKVKYECIHTSAKV